MDFYNTVSLLFGTVAEWCTPESCPTMAAGAKYEYLWAPAQGAKPVRLPACDYIDEVMRATEDALGNEAVFPTAPGAPFPRTFRAEVEKIFKRLFRVFAHIYFQ